MSSFKEFMDEAEKSPNEALPNSDMSLSSIQSDLIAAISGLLTPFSTSADEKHKFSEEVSKQLHDETFLSEFSNRIDEPLEQESEDEFVKRSSDVLKKMLHNKFRIKG